MSDKPTRRDISRAFRDLMNSQATIGERTASSSAGSDGATRRNSDVAPTTREGAAPTTREDASPTTREGAVPATREGVPPTVREGAAAATTTREGAPPATREDAVAVPTVHEGAAPTTRESATAAPTVREGAPPTVREGVPPTTREGATAAPTTREGAAPTIRESPVPTTREQAAALRGSPTSFAEATAREQQAAPTQREGAGTLGNGALGNGTTPHSRLWIPPAVARDFEWVEDIQTQGGESDNAVMRHRTTGRLVFFKSYRSGIRPDLLAMKRLQEADREHVIEIIDYQINDDSAWEIQEYCELGSLGDWVRRQGGRLDHDTLRTVVQELSSALAHLNERDMSHRDLKPANVLVRTEDPLDLVLTDFGLARANQAFTHVTQFAQGTWLYAAPEVHSKVSSLKSDWFSLGAMIYEFYTGRCLFSDEDGRPENLNVASYRCTHGNYSTSAIDDERWLMLVDGLVQAERDYRWSAREVFEWLDGGSPPVHQRHSGIGYSPEDVRPQFYIDDWCEGTVIGNPRELVEAFGQHWQGAASVLAGRKRNDIVTFLTGFPNTEQAIEIVKSNDSPDAKIIKLYGIFAADTVPEFQGRALNAESLQQAIETAQEGDAEALDWLGVLVERRILKALGESTGNEQAARADAQLHEWREQSERIAGMAPPRQANLARSAFREALPQLYQHAFSEADNS